MNSLMIRSSGVLINTGSNIFTFNVTESTYTNASRPNNNFCLATITVYKDNTLIDTFTASDSASNNFGFNLGVPHKYNDNLNNIITVTPQEVYGSIDAGQTIWQCTNSWKIEYTLNYSKNSINYNIIPSKSSYLPGENTSFIISIKNNLNVNVNGILHLHYTAPSALGDNTINEDKIITLIPLQNQNITINLPSLKKDEQYKINSEFEASVNGLISGLNYQTKLAHVQGRYCDSDYNADFSSIWGLTSDRQFPLYKLINDEFIVSYIGENITIENKTTYYRLTNNCSSIQLLSSEITTNDYLNLTTCQSNINYNNQTNNQSQTNQTTQNNTQTNTTINQTHIITCYKFSTFLPQTSLNLTSNNPCHSYLISSNSCTPDYSTNEQCNLAYQSEPFYIRLWHEYGLIVTIIGAIIGLIASIWTIIKLINRRKKK